MAEIEVVDVATASERTDSPRLVQTEQTDLAASVPVQEEEPVPPPPALERAVSVAEPKAKAKKAAARKPRAAPVKPSKPPPPCSTETPARWVEPPRIASHFDLLPQIDKALNDYISYQQSAERERQAAVYRSVRPF